MVRKSCLTRTRDAATFCGRRWGRRSWEYSVVLGVEDGEAGVVGSSRCGKPLQTGGREGLEGLGSWWGPSGGLDLDSFSSHTEANQAVTVADGVEGRRFLGGNAVLGEEPLAAH